MNLYYALGATLIISLLAVLGIIFLNKSYNKKWLKIFVGLAVGTLLGAVFFDLLPETMELFEEPHDAAFIILLSILGFFTIEKAIHYHHCLCEDEEKKHKKNHLIVNNLIGDGLHNFVDGIIIGGAFLVDVKLGIGATIAVALHEIPQEIADFSILVYAGLSRFKAIMYNLLFGLTSVLGVILVFATAEKAQNLVPYILAIATGNFIYLAMADLIPELHHENNSKKIWLQMLWVVLGLAIIKIITSLFGHE